jgi:hypothetical protein
MARVRVRLEQSEQIQTVEAIHSNYPLGRKVGVLMLCVPSTQALLETIDARQDYAFLIRRVDIDTRGGTASSIVTGHGHPCAQPSVQPGSFKPC